MIGQIKLLGHEYTEPTEIRLSNGLYICRKGAKVVLTEKAFCNEDIHYFEENPKKPIPKDTIVKINYCWANFEGTFVNVKHNGKNYDIKPSSLKHDSNFA